MKEETGKLEKGLKYDSGKNLWNLLPMGQIEKIVEILTFGANKYTANSWQQVENGVERYYAALLRHIVDWRKGENIDPESQKTHLAHAACNILFLMYLTEEDSAFDQPALKTEEDELFKQQAEILKSQTYTVRR